MNTNDHLLVVAAEETSETAVRLCKILRFGPDDIEPGQNLTARQRAQNEIYDFLASLQDLQTAEIIQIPMDRSAELAIEAKRVKVQQMLEYSRKVGRLVDDVRQGEPDDPDIVL